MANPLLLEETVLASAFGENMRVESLTSGHPRPATLRFSCVAQASRSISSTGARVGNSAIKHAPGKIEPPAGQQELPRVNAASTEKEELV
jgi:hypothetical protein